MIIGGQAVLVYGEPRLTKDVNVTIGVGLESLTNIKDLPLSMNFNPLMDKDDFTKKTMVLPCQDSETGLRVNVIFRTRRTTSKLLVGFEKLLWKGSKSVLQESKMW